MRGSKARKNILLLHIPPLSSHFGYICYSVKERALNSLLRTYRRKAPYRAIVMLTITYAVLETLEKRHCSVSMLKKDVYLMSTKILILGSPGSGKSTAALRVLEIAGGYKLYAIRLDDYEELREIFKHDSEHQRFRPADFNSFEITDVTVLNEALADVKGKTLELIKLMYPRNGLIIMEFARDDYTQAFEVLGASFLQDAYFICLNANINICRKRIHKRMSQPDVDNHFVTDNILNTYYQGDIRQHLSVLFMSYGIDEQKVHFVENSRGSLARFERKIDEIVRSIVAAILNQRTYASQNTDNLPITRPEPITRPDRGQEADSVPEHSSFERGCA